MLKISEKIFPKASEKCTEIQYAEEHLHVKNREEVRYPMRKKALLFALLAVIFLAALCICLGLFLLRQDKTGTDRAEITATTQTDTAEEETTETVVTPEASTEAKKTTLRF